MTNQIKDNRVDNFCRMIPFEFDRASGLWLPEGVHFERESEPQPKQYKDYHRTRTWKTVPPPDSKSPITLETLEEAHRQVREKLMEDAMNDLWRVKSGPRPIRLSELVSDADQLGDAVQGWVDAEEKSK